MLGSVGYQFAHPDFGNKQDYGDMDLPHMIKFPVVLPHSFIILLVYCFKNSLFFDLLIIWYIKCHILCPFII